MLRFVLSVPLLVVFRVPVACLDTDSSRSEFVSLSEDPVLLAVLVPVRLAVLLPVLWAVRSLASCRVDSPVLEDSPSRDEFEDLLIEEVFDALEELVDSAMRLFSELRSEVLSRVDEAV